jgi:hypothetical protein
MSKPLKKKVYSKFKLNIIFVAKSFELLYTGAGTIVLYLARFVAGCQIYSNHKVKIFPYFHLILPDSRSNFESLL